MTNPDQHYVRGIPRSFLRMLLARVGMLGVLAACVALALWSYFIRLKPVSRQFQEKTTLISALSEQVQELQLNWDTLDADRTEQKFTQARELLFAGPTAPADWQKEVLTQTLALAFEVRPTLGKAQPHKVGKRELSIVPATLDLQPASAARMTNAPYNRLLTFLRNLESKHKRVDLVELSASGSSNSVEQARAVVHLWTEERSPK